jgi:purine-binding chemotaxis protein CheW
MSEVCQYCTFQVGNNIFGVPVLDVQEVISPQVKTRVPLAQDQIGGLINLRGQIVTLIGLRNLFGFETKSGDEGMNLVVKSNDSLFALVIDEIQDVLEVEAESFEKTPATLDQKIRPFIKGIHKLPGKLLIVLNLEKIFDF